MPDVSAKQIWARDILQTNGTALQKNSIVESTEI